jgi:hypothetical protein
VIISRRMRRVGHVACLGERRGVYRVLVGKPEGKRPLGRPKLRWEDNIKMDLITDPKFLPLHGFLNFALFSPITAYK